MTIKEWIEQGMENEGIKTQAELAELAGVSQPTISLGKKRNSFRNSTLEKIEAVIGPYLSKPNQIKKITDEEFNTPQKTTLEESVKRFRGDSCPTTSRLCRACWGKLKTTDENTPVTRAMCRLTHSWVLEGGKMFFKDEDGELIREENL